MPGFQIDQINEHDDVIEIVTHGVGAEAICPACQQRSGRIHSYDLRSPVDSLAPPVVWLLLPMQK